MEFSLMISAICFGQTFLLLWCFTRWMVSKKRLQKKVEVENQLCSDLSRLQTELSESRAIIESAQQKIVDLTQRNGQLEARVDEYQLNENKRFSHYEDQLRMERHQVENLKDEYRTLNEKFLDASRALAGLETQTAALKDQLSTQKDQEENNLKLLRREFESLTQQVTEVNSNKLQHHANQQIGNMVDGLKEQFKNFSEKVERLSDVESKERVALKTEISRLVTVGDTMSEKTTNLTNAMTNNHKVQGNWGELQLERALEISGLIKGLDFTLQRHGIDLMTEDGKRQIPDAIIHLPDQKQILIDAKVTLSAFIKYVNSESTKTGERYLEDFVKCIRRHIDILHEKNYQSHKNLRSPEFILMYFPLEGGLSEARKYDPDLITYAWKKGVAIASPMTLSPILCTVSSLWKIEKQNRFAMEIAEEGGKLYDKFVTFVDSLKAVGKHLEGAQKCYDQSLIKLTTGRGNLIGKAQKMLELGAKAKKKLSRDLIEGEPNQGINGITP